MLLGAVKFIAITGKGFDMSSLISHENRRLTAAEFQHLATVPAAVEWFANIDNPRTRRAYQNDLQDFCSFVGLSAAEEFRAVTRSHVLAWRAQLEHRGLAGATIRRKLAALASLFDHLLELNAVAGGNPVHGVKRPRIETNEGKTPALGDHQAKALLDITRCDHVEGAPRSSTTGRAAVSRPTPRGSRTVESQRYPGAQGYQASAYPRQGRQGALSAAAPDRRRAYLRVLGAFRASPGRRSGTAVCAATRAFYWHRHNRQRNLRNCRKLCQGGRYQCRWVGRAWPACHGCDQCLGARSRYCEGPGMAGPCQYQHDPDL
ncbi:hypothetical protein ALP39_04482 [Pseudomonas marginalis pv. marginalis]|nr:hypothetical protein ALP39_04482 [Pseudomonas marginalis pv. marginalis]